MRNQTIYFKNNDVGILETATIAGPKEGEGPLGRYFHNVLKDDLLKQRAMKKPKPKFIYLL